MTVLDAFEVLYGEFFDVHGMSPFLGNRGFIQGISSHQHFPRKCFAAGEAALGAAVSR